MAIRKMRLEGDSILAKKCRPVELFDERLFTLLDDMGETLKEQDGVGLAAPQVGVLRRVVVMQLPDQETIELINPEIIGSEGEQKCVEACLSLPGKYGVTSRPQKVTVRAMDREGEWHAYEGEDLAARCFCHEIDHLDGILYSDRLAPGETIHLDDEADD